MKQNKNIPQGYKDSPLGIIPKEWEVKRLEDLCNNSGDYGINASATYYSVDFPTYLRITDIDENGRFIQKNKKSINDKDSYKYYLREGDIVFARTGATVGKTYLYNEKDGRLVFAGFLIRFSPNKNLLLPFYLKAITETKLYWNWVNKISVRSGQPGINSNEYCSLKILVPPLPEQKKIAEILIVWDMAIEKQTALIEKLEERKKGLMQQLLTGKKRLNGFSNEWKKVKLSTCCNRVVRKNIYNCENIVTVSAQKGFIQQTEFFNKRIASDVIDNYYLVKRDEFCYNKSYCNGSPMGAIKRLKEFDKAVVTTLYICFSINKNLIDINYIEQYFDAGILNKYLMKIANEGGRAHGLLNVTPSDFFNIIIEIPPLIEQTSIASILTVVDKEIDLMKSKLKYLQKQKKGLMQVLLTGKKRVKQ